MQQYIKSKSEEKKLSKATVLIAGFAILSVLGYWVSNQFIFSLNKELQVRIENPLTVFTNDESQIVRGVGKIVSLKKQFISTSEKGQIETLFVSRGELVSAGDPLFTLNNPTLIREAKEAEFAKNETYSDVAMRRSELNLQRYQLQSQLAKSKTKVKKQQLELEANQKLKKLGIVSSIKYEQQQLSAEQAKQDVINLERQIALFDKSYNEQLSALDLKLAAAKEKVEYYEYRLKSLTVKATLDGIIKDVDIAPGQSVNLGETLVEIVGDNPLYAEVQIPQYSVNKIAVNDSATIETPSGSVSGRVDFIDPIIRGGSTIVRLELLNEMPKWLSLDQSIEAKIEAFATQRIASVTIPVDFEQHDQWTVYRLEGNQIVRTEVNISLGNSDNLVLTPALAPGEKVVLLPKEIANEMFYSQ